MDTNENGGSKKGQNKKRQLIRVSRLLLHTSMNTYHTNTMLILKRTTLHLKINFDVASFRMQKSVPLMNHSVQGMIKVYTINKTKIVPTR